MQIQTAVFKVNLHFTSEQEFNVLLQSWVNTGNVGSLGLNQRLTEMPNICTYICSYLKILLELNTTELSFVLWINGVIYETTIKSQKTKAYEVK